MLDLGTPRTERVRPISAHESGPGVCMTYLTPASNPQTLVNSGEDAVLASQAGKVGLVAHLLPSIFHFPPLIFGNFSPISVVKMDQVCRFLLPIGASHFR